MPQLADMITFGLASSRRVASSLAAKPPNTTEWIGADARAGEHRDQRLRHHRHIEDDAVAAHDPEIGEHAGERLHLVEELRIGERALLAPVTGES